MDALTRQTLAGLGWLEQPGRDADGNAYLDFVRGSEMFRVSLASALDIKNERVPYGTCGRSANTVIISERHIDKDLRSARHAASKIQPCAHGVSLGSCCPTCHADGLCSFGHDLVVDALAKTETGQIIEDIASAAWAAAIDPNQGEEFRVGLPAEALRKAWPDWEQDITQWPYRILRIRFTPDAGRWSCPGLATWADGHTEPLEHHGKWPGMRPFGASWMEVELKAAALLGAADRKAKRERRSDWELANALGNPKPGAAKGREYENAYRTAYEDAGNSSAKKGDR